MDFENRRNRFFLVFIVISALVIVLGFTVGFFVPHIGEYEDSHEIAAHDPDLREAKEKNAELNEETARLFAERAEKKATLKSIENYDGEGKTELDDLTSELNELNSRIEEKKKEADTDTEADGSITLSPGIYTVGKHIPSGSYYVSGGGSLVVSDQSGNKINSPLSKEAAEYELSDGDTVKIEASVKFDTEPR